MNIILYRCLFAANPCGRYIVGSGWFESFGDAKAIVDSHKEENRPAFVEAQEQFRANL